MDEEMKEFEIEKPMAELMPKEQKIRIVPRAPVQDLMLTAAFDVETAEKRLKELKAFVQMYMHEGEDYGTIPGTPKPTLYKPGADKLCDIYAIADTYRVTSRTEDWDRNLFDYEIECTLVSKRSGGLVATGLGSCNSFEGKYRWREQKKKCPSCQKETIIKGQEKYGSGWVCWKKKDGCGAKFADGEKTIEDQPSGKVENEDIPTLKNTILKMAKKRAKVDAVLSATRSSGLFTQDIEDWQAVETLEESKQGQQAVADKKIRESTKGNETLSLVEWKDGTLAMTGNGVAIVKANMTESEKDKFNVQFDRGGKVYVIRQSDGIAFEDVCKKYNVPVKWADRI